MRQGCISLGNIWCDECHRLIMHAERYLIIEGTGGDKKRLCKDCSLERGYARYKDEKGEQVLTFFLE